MNDDPQMRFDFGRVTTPGGWALDVAVSTLQKATRRGDEAMALTAAREMVEAGYEPWLWRRLKVIASEDVSLGWLDGPAVIAALFDAWAEAKKAEKGREGVTNRVLYIAHAVIALCRAPKTRVVDNAVAVFWAGPREPVDPPAYAIDRHTAAGRRLRRDPAEEHANSYLIENAAADVDNPYADAARAIALDLTRQEG